MNALVTDTHDQTYSARPPILLAASSDAAMARAEAAVVAAGHRVGAALPVDQLAERVENQIATAAIWLELDRDCGGPMDDLLGKISRDVERGRYGAVVSTSAALIDPISAGLGESEVEVIVDADGAQRAAALAVALAGKSRPLRLCDVASDRSAERLRQLSEEVNRIASTLAQLSTVPIAAPRSAPKVAWSAEEDSVSAERIRAVIHARRLRTRFFPDDMFADPAWDMMLDLLQAEIAQLRVPVSSLCIAAAVPATTALRWLKSLVAQGLFVRRGDPHDGRRVFVELAPATSQALRQYFHEVRSIAVV